MNNAGKYTKDISKVYKIIPENERKTRPYTKINLNCPSAVNETDNHF